MCQDLQLGLQWQLWLDCALLSPFVILCGEGFYIYIMHGMNQLWISQPSLCFLHTWGQGPGRLAVQSIPGYLEIHPTWISGKEEPHCFGRTCTMSFLWACSKRFLHVGMWRGWYFSESKNKPPLLLIQIPFLKDGLWHKIGQYYYWLLKQEEKRLELLLFWGTR